MNITIYEALAKYKKDDTLPYTECGTLGVFSEYEYATLAKEKYSTWDIFIVHGVDNFGIGKVVLNERQWVDGFVKVYD